MPTNESCPNCGKMLFRKKGKSMLVCHESDCGYSREITETAKNEAED
jgi:DNA topoisomerase-1